MSDFKHIHTAHCENGVVTNLLKHHGVEEMTEPLAFGIGSGLFYTHLPFLKVAGGPMIAFRSLPGGIFSRTCKALNVKVEKHRFKDKNEAKDFLDRKVDEKTLVACQVGVFHLSYFPREYRFHFNAHNLIVYGKNDENYLVSDPVMENLTELSFYQMERARFAQGPLAPKGLIYYPVDVPKVSRQDLRKAIVKGIKKNATSMLNVPLPGMFIGAEGIKYTARRVRKLRDKMGVEKAGLFLGQIVRMQEEIGTGGGGFRFLYGAFLQQAADHLADDRLLKVSDQIIETGDRWRDSAVLMAGIYKGRLTEQKDFDNVADLMVEIANKEKQIFKDLRKLKLKA